MIDSMKMYSKVIEASNQFWETLKDNPILSPTQKIRLETIIDKMHYTPPETLHERVHQLMNFFRQEFPNSESMQNSWSGYVDRLDKITRGEK